MAKKFVNVDEEMMVEEERLLELEVRRYEMLLKRAQVKDRRKS